MSHESPWEEHFGSRENQVKAAQLGMWIFLASEVLLFASLFTGYAYYRHSYPEVFREGSHHLEAVAATVQTLLLVTSSLLVALAVRYARQGRMVVVVGMLVGAMLMGAGFLAIKGWEYWKHALEGALPGEYYHFEKLAVQGGSLFYTVYYLMTGLHALHMLVGLGVLGWLAFQAVSGRYTSEYHTPIEVGGLYWHLVDIFWLFIYPLLYLI